MQYSTYEPLAVTLFVGGISFANGKLKTVFMYYLYGYALN